jgi:AraC family transcriptional regulator
MGCPCEYRCRRAVNRFCQQAARKALTFVLLLCIVAEYGTHASLRRRRDWPGVSCLLYDLHWETQPGWVTWSFEQPTLCFMVEEIGGRAELRARPDAPSEGEYFGDGHLTLLAAAEPIAVHASSLRQAQFACFVLYPPQAGCLTVDQADLIGNACSRLMFQDERLRSCAQMLSDYEGEGEHDIYAIGLSRALLAAVLHVVSNPARSSEQRLTGGRLARVLAHIDEHLDQKITNESLARIAKISAAEFGHAFREATGLSPLRWQMDARVRLAQRLMMDNPAHSLALIAVRSGFADQSHFSRAFLDIVGMTPTAWLHQRH